MQGFIWKLPGLRRIGPFHQGLLESVGAVVLLGLVFWIAFSINHIRPSPNLLVNGAQICATLLVAYAVIATTIISKARAEPGVDRQNRLGALSGVGGFGFAAVLVLLGLSERSAAGHWIWPDELLFGFASIAPVTLGVMVALQPMAIDSWSTADSDE